jgi:uncharacterized protein YukJ
MEVVAMAAGYGVLRGRVDRWVREDGDATPHLQVRVLDETGQPWRIAVNVQSDTGSEVVYWLVDPLQGHPILSGLGALPSGFSTAAQSPTGALDYVRAPLFAWGSGTALPASGSASSDDLQDLLALHLQHCQDAGGEVFAFGVRFGSNLHKPIDAQFGNTDGLHGVHDIHLNQGNAGAHAGDNGALHDGGLILALPDRHVGLFLAFQSQRVPTDSDGDPTSQSRPIAELIVEPSPSPPEPPAPGPSPTPSPSPLSAETVYLERALLNPTADDVGNEAVVIGNLANAAASLQGWRLVDKNHRTTDLGSVTVPPGGSLLVALDGSGVQLSNKGGNLVLLDPEGRQVDAVVYSVSDASTENRFVRFRR